MRGQYVRLFHPTGFYPPIIPDFSDTLGDQAGCTPNQVRLGSLAMTGNDTYKGWGARVTGASTQTRIVTGYNGSTKIATLDGNWDAPLPSAGSAIILVKPEMAPFMYLQGRAVLNVAEIEVYPDWTSPDSATNLARGGLATMSGNGIGGDGKSYPAGNAIDGNYANFALSGYDGTGPVWWIVDLKKEVDIGIIRLVNRRDAVQSTRMFGFQFEILDGSSKVIYTSNPVTTVMQTYEVFPPDKNVSGTMSTAGWTGSFFTQFTPFSACSAPCNTGTRKRIRGMVPNSDGSTISSNPADLVEMQQCNTQACPSFSSWSDYGACKDGKRTRTRALVSGLAGPGDTLMEAEDCEMPAVYSTWGEYGECKNGKKSRDRTVVSGSNWTAADLREETTCTATPIQTISVQNAPATVPSSEKTSIQYWEDLKIPISIAIGVTSIILICCICRCFKGSNPKY